MLVGKFYELYSELNVKTGLFYPPLKQVTEIMNIALKVKDTQQEAGVPEQSLHKFAQTLTREGWTVVVVDQVKDSSDDVIDRIPTRVLSPGTHIETAGQERMSVAGIWAESNAFAASVMDLTTGEVFSYTTPHSDSLLHMFQVYCVKEVILSGPRQMEEADARSQFNIRGPLQQIPFDTYSVFDNSFRREEYFRKLFRVRGLLPVRTVLGLEGQEPILERALCVLLRFVEDHFLQQAERLTSHTLYCPKSHMRLSNNILEQLNMITSNKQKSVLSLLDRTHSALGKRTLRERILRPITDSVELERRWNQVAFALQLPIERRQVLERFLKTLYDLPRLHFKVSEGKLEASDILQMFSSYSATICLLQNTLESPLACSPELAEKIQEYRVHFRKMFDEEKAGARQNDELCGFLTPMSGPKTCALEEQISVLQKEWKTKWLAFCVENAMPPDNWKLVKKGQQGEEDWVWEGPRSTMKILQAKAKSSQVLKGLEVESRKSGPITITCQEWNGTIGKIRSAWTQLGKCMREETLNVCDDLWGTVKEFHDEWVAWLGSLDCSLSLASVAAEHDWCRPTIGNSLSIKGLRHPLLESAATRMAYVKHDIALGGPGTEDTYGDPRGWLIYGVNASGKSSLMKATGIAVLLAQAGSFVPASEMKIRPYDAAFSRIWNQDNVWAGLSSFAVEVSELKDILEGATSESLILGDEVCSGTESSSATALVASVLEHLDGTGAHYLFATHLHDLINVPRLLPRPGIAVWHLRVDRMADGKLVYDRRLQPGPGSCSYGLEVAKAMGLPLALMNRAYEIRRELEGQAAANEAPKSTWNAAIQRQACEICGHDVVRDLEVHHLLERARGGGNQLRNLAVLCERCHDKHHAGEIEVGPLVQTSEGLERASTVRTVTVDGNEGASVNGHVRRKKQEWTPEQETLIRETVRKLQGRPLTRIITALAEEGISMKPAQLKKFGVP